MVEDCVANDLSFGIVPVIEKKLSDIGTEMEILEDVSAGGLIVVFIDPSTGFVTWAGAATAELMEEPDTETAKARLDYVVTKMFKELPKK